MALFPGCETWELADKKLWEEGLAGWVPPGPKDKDGRLPKYA